MVPDDGSLLQWFMGAIAGYNDGLIQNCYRAGKDMTANSWQGVQILMLGGIASYNGQNGEIYSCYNNSNIEAIKRNSTKGFYGAAHCVTVGGIAAINEGMVANCYNSGEIMGVYRPGSGAPTVQHSSKTGGMIGVNLNRAGTAAGTTGNLRNTAYYEHFVLAPYQSNLYKTPELVRSFTIDNAQKLVAYDALAGAGTPMPVAYPTDMARDRSDSVLIPVFYMDNTNTVIQNSPYQRLVYSRNIAALGWNSKPIRGSGNSTGNFFQPNDSVADVPCPDPGLQNYLYYGNSASTTGSVTFYRADTILASQYGAFRLPSYPFSGVNGPPAPNTFGYQADQLQGKTPCMAGQDVLNHVLNAGRDTLAAGSSAFERDPAINKGLPQLTDNPHKGATVLDAPAVLSVTEVFGEHLVRWTPDANAHEYEIWYKPEGGTDYIQAKTAGAYNGAEGVSIALPERLIGQTVLIAVRAMGIAIKNPDGSIKATYTDSPVGERPFSYTVPVPKPVLAMEALRETDDGHFEADLVWSAVYGAGGYQVCHADINGNTQILYATPDAATTRATVTILKGAGLENLLFVVPVMPAGVQPSVSNLLDLRQCGLQAADWGAVTSPDEGNEALFSYTAMLRFSDDRITGIGAVIFDEHDAAVLTVPAKMGELPGTAMVTFSLTEAQRDAAVRVEFVPVFQSEFADSPPGAYALLTNIFHDALPNETPPAQILGMSFWGELLAVLSLGILAVFR